MCYKQENCEHYDNAQRSYTKECIFYLKYNEKDRCIPNWSPVPLSDLEKKLIETKFEGENHA